MTCEEMQIFTWKMEDHFPSFLITETTMIKFIAIYVILLYQSALKNLQAILKVVAISIGYLTSSFLQEHFLVLKPCVFIVM